MGKRKKKRTLQFFLVLCIAVLALIFFHQPCLRLIYVRNYSDIISAYCAEYEVQEELIYAVIWCESRFRKDAESSAGACGLMQLRKTTFEEMLMRLDLPKYGDIFSPELNIRCGIYYLYYLYGLYGDWSVALAAYNAGMGNVNEWLSDTRYSDDGATLKAIPFDETEAYVQKVLDTKEMYRKLYKKE